MKVRHPDRNSELRSAAISLNEIYDTALTNDLLLLVDETENELRQMKKCQFCPNETTRWQCDKPHQPN